MNQVDHRLADDFRGRVAKDAFEGGAGVKVTALGIHHADGIEQQVGDVGQRGGGGFFHGAMAWDRPCRHSGRGDGFHFSVKNRIEWTFPAGASVPRIGGLYRVPCACVASGFAR